jgi:GxxExxY protein
LCQDATFQKGGLSMANPAIISLPRVNQVTGAIVTAAMKVHSELGPGLMESAYEACMIHELRKQGLKAAGQVILPVIYDGEKIDTGHRIDVLVEDLVVLELKCVESLHPIHEAQLLSYYD